MSRTQKKISKKEIKTYKKYRKSSKNERKTYKKYGKTYKKGGNKFTKGKKKEDKRHHPYKKNPTSNTHIKSNLGSDTRNELVQSFRKNNMDNYKKIVFKIRDDPITRKEFFNHINRKIDTFSPNTIKALKQAYIWLQEDAVPETMSNASNWKLIVENNN
uniref:Uncharacterized protein n=1 Tax=viral metagenome TaxID=1070528 RepID=A0A6C0KJ74_9ZZZZ